MPDRQWLGDFALAVLLALPLATLAKAQPQASHHAAKVSRVALAVEVGPAGRMSLLG